MERARRRTGGVRLPRAAAGALAAAVVAAYGVAAVANAQSTQLPMVACPRGLDDPIYPRGQSCYQFNDEEKTWDSARTSCHQGNGRLVVITDSDLQSWLSSTVSGLWPTRQGVWLGLNDRATKDTYLWDSYGNTAQPGNYFNWMTDYPSDPLDVRNCVYMRRSFAWRWANIVCSFNTYGYICEYPAVYMNATTAAQLPVTFGTSTPSSADNGAGSTFPWVTGYAPATPSTHSNQTAMNATPAPSRSALVVPLSAAAAALVVVAGIAAVLVWLFRCRRSRMPKLGNRSTASTGRSTVIVQNPIYASDDAPVGLADLQPTTGAAAAAAASADGRHWRPPSNVYIDMSTAAAPGSRGLQEPETGPLYAEPFQSSQQPASSRSDGATAAAVKSAECAPGCHEYTYIDVVPLLKCQQEAATSRGAGEQDYEVPSAPSAGLSQDAAQDGYEPVRSQWNPYENLPKPDLQ